MVPQPSSTKLAVLTTSTSSDVTGDAIDEGPAGVSRFVNKGTLAQTSLATGVSEIHVDVTDTGTLSVEDNSNLRFFGANNSFSGTYVGGGMIDYWGGSTNALGTIDMTNGACTTVDEGATVNQSGVVTLSTSSTITLVTGTWNFTSNNGLALADPSHPGSSGASFTLYETLAKTGGTGTTVIGCDFNPNGGGSGSSTSRTAPLPLMASSATSTMRSPAPAPSASAAVAPTRSVPAPPLILAAGPSHTQAPM